MYFHAFERGFDDAPLDPEAEAVWSREPRGLMSPTQHIPSGIARRMASWNALTKSCDERSKSQKRVCLCVRNSSGVEG